MTIMTSAAVVFLTITALSSSSSSFYVAGQPSTSSSTVPCPAATTEPTTVAEPVTVRIHNNCGNETSPPLDFYSAPKGGGPATSKATIHHGRCNRITMSYGYNLFNSDRNGSFNIKPEHPGSTVFEASAAQFDGSFNAINTSIKQTMYGITIVNNNQTIKPIVCLGKGYGKEEGGPDPNCYPPQSTSYPCYTQPCFSEAYNHNGEEYPQNLIFDVYWCNRRGDSNTEGKCGTDNCVKYTNRCCQDDNKSCDGNNENNHCNGSSCKAETLCKLGKRCKEKLIDAKSFKPACGVANLKAQDQCYEKDYMCTTSSEKINKKDPYYPQDAIWCSTICNYPTKLCPNCIQKEGDPFYNCAIPGDVDGATEYACGKDESGGCAYAPTPDNPSIPEGFCPYFQAPWSTPVPTPAPDIGGPDQPDTCASIKDKRSCKKSGGCKWKRFSRTCSNNPKSSKGGKRGKSSKNKKEIFE